MAGQQELQMEFAVQMTCASCEKDVRQALSVEGIHNVFVDVANELVLVNSTLPSSDVTRLLESTGKLVVFRGLGGGANSSSSRLHQAAAVAIMKGVGGVKGLARLVQVSDDQCVVEGTIDGLTGGHTHLVQVHEYGDLSSGCANCGDVLGRLEGQEESLSIGHLCFVTPDDAGRAVFQAVSNRMKVKDIIGRSMVVSIGPSSVISNRLMCGIIARSAGLFENTKKVCTCDGVTLWDEAEKQRNNNYN